MLPQVLQHECLSLKHSLHVNSIYSIVYSGTKISYQKRLLGAIWIWDPVNVILRIKLFIKT
jgi:hypothetical protein